MRDESRFQPGSPFIPNPSSLIPSRCHVSTLRWTFADNSAARFRTVAPPPKSQNLLRHQPRAVQFRIGQRLVELRDDLVEQAGGNVGDHFLHVAERVFPPGGIANPVRGQQLLGVGGRQPEGLAHGGRHGGESAVAELPREHRPAVPEDAEGGAARPPVQGADGRRGLAAPRRRRRRRPGRRPGRWPAGARR